MCPFPSQTTPEPFPSGICQYQCIRTFALVMAMQYQLQIIFCQIKNEIWKQWKPKIELINVRGHRYLNHTSYVELGAQRHIENVNNRVCVFLKELDNSFLPFTHHKRLHSLKPSMKKWIFLKLVAKMINGKPRWGRVNQMETQGELLVQLSKMDPLKLELLYPEDS